MVVIPRSDCFAMLKKLSKYFPVGHPFQTLSEITHDALDNILKTVTHLFSDLNACSIVQLKPFKYWFAIRTMF